MRKPTLFLIGLLMFTGCQVVNKEGGKSTVSEQLYQQTAVSQAGVITAAQPLATKAGVDMHEQGGNAVDAAVVSAFALAVVEQCLQVQACSSSIF